MILNDGKSFEINEGIPVSFAQYLTLIKCEKEKEKEGELNSPTALNSTSSSSHPELPYIKSEQRVDGSQKDQMGGGLSSGKRKKTNAIIQDNSLYFLKQIKNKLIVTPEFDIKKKEFNSLQVSESPFAKAHNTSSYMETGLFNLLFFPLFLIY